MIRPGRAKVRFSLKPTAWVLSGPSGAAAEYARFVFYAIATNTMHKGYYIFVHPFNTPDSLRATLLPALPS